MVVWFRELEIAIEAGAVTPNSDPIMIIGAGLSAADAIICAQVIVQNVINCLLYNGRWLYPYNQDDFFIKILIRNTKHVIKVKFFLINSLSWLHMCICINAV